MVGGGAGAGAECCQLCWLRDDEESWHGDRHGDYRRVTRHWDTTSRAMLTFPIVLVTGETNSGTHNPACLCWCSGSLTLRGFHFLIVLYFHLGFVFGRTLRSISECQQSWTFLEWCGLRVGGVGFSNFNLMEHLKDNWQLDPNIPPTYFILPAHPAKLWWWK